MAAADVEGPTLFCERPEWEDVTPIAQYENITPLAPIFYSNECASCVVQPASVDLTCSHNVLEFRLHIVHLLLVSCDVCRQGCH